MTVQSQSKDKLFLWTIYSPKLNWRVNTVGKEIKWLQINLGTPVYERIGKFFKFWDMAGLVGYTLLAQVGG